MTPLPNLPEREHELDEREKEMSKSNWFVSVGSYAQLGIAIATFNRAIGPGDFDGMAEMKVEDRTVTLEITLVFEMPECTWSTRTGPKCGLPFCEKCGGIPF